MGQCLPDDMKKYIAQHMRDDAEHHLSMTTPKFRESHKVMWGYIDFETWAKVMKAQANYSDKAAEFIESIPNCEE